MTTLNQRHDQPVAQQRPPPFISPGPAFLRTNSRAAMGRLTVVDVPHNPYKSKRESAANAGT
ncbi:hypothetical protein [Rhizobium glycinendophyticum]|uniref:Uncharacterized protein n=1 Tax=Rhizobium glycinendophyticum TaxID=2589807 RepID=A0A504U789_9HYPH|nr:hypothetical protein [Rhizobium glycinendophyticum]TPP10319.1 hypothetical protein FJQ55_05495 [Rhizobium glycinendophyticum]